MRGRFMVAVSNAAAVDPVLHRAGLALARAVPFVIWAGGA